LTKVHQLSTRCNPRSASLKNALHPILGLCDVRLVKQELDAVCRVRDVCAWESDVDGVDKRVPKEFREPQ